MKESAADQIWNRAAQDEGGPSPGPGDHALTSLLRLHGLAMNGGVHHAIDMLDVEELLAAIDGYTYFGFEGLADWFRNAALIHC